MHRPSFVRLGAVAALLAAVSCRPQPQSWPTEAADLTGRVVDARLVRGMDDVSITFSPPGGATAGGTIQRLEIRVAGSRTMAPGALAHVGVDGTTQVIRRDASAGRDDRPKLEGAFVRIWLKGVPTRSTPTALTAMARVVAIDSVASVATRD